MQTAISAVESVIVRNLGQLTTALFTYIDIIATLCHWYFFNQLILTNLLQGRTRNRMS
ncbi:MAG: hypothetical protein WB661_08110 [Candidatus Bathyarchaeia archaeon]